MVAETLEAHSAQRQMIQLFLASDTNERYRRLQKLFNVMPFEWLRIVEISIACTNYSPASRCIVCLHTIIDQSASGKRRFRDKAPYLYRMVQVGRAASPRPSRVIKTRITYGKRVSLNADTSKSHDAMASIVYYKRRGRIRCLEGLPREDCLLPNNILGLGLMPLKSFYDLVIEAYNVVFVIRCTMLNCGSWMTIIEPS